MKTKIQNRRALGNVIATLMLGLAAALPVSARNGEPTVSVAGLSLAGVAQFDGITYASFVDAQTGDHFIVTTRSPEVSGLQLVGLTPSQDAIVRQDGQSYLLRLGWSSPGSAVPAWSPVAAASANSSAASGSPGILVPPKDGVLPLVFQSGNLKNFQLNDEQKGIIAQLRQKFLAAIGSDGASAAAGSSSAASTPDTSASLAQNDPAAGSASAASSASADSRRAQVWQDAQQQSDAEFKMLFGTQAFNLYQMSLGSSPQP